MLLELPVDWCEPEGEIPDLHGFIKALDERVLNSISETALSFTNAFSQSSESTPLDRSHLSTMANRVMVSYLEQMGKALAVEAAAGKPTHRRGEWLSQVLVCILLLEPVQHNSVCRSMLY